MIILLQPPSHLNGCLEVNKIVDKMSTIVELSETSKCIVLLKDDIGEQTYKGWYFHQKNSCKYLKVNSLKQNDRN